MSADLSILSGFTTDQLLDEIRSRMLQAVTPPVVAPPPPELPAPAPVVLQAHEREDFAGEPIKPFGPYSEDRVVNEAIMDLKPGETDDAPHFITHGEERMAIAEGQLESLREDLKHLDQDERSQLQRMIDTRTSSMRSMSLGAVVAANKANAEDAFIQPILPPDFSKMSSPRRHIGVEAWDHPQTIELEFVQHAADPVWQHVATSLENDIHVKHLIGPVWTPKTDTSIQIQAEPVLLWRLVYHCQTLPNVDSATRWFLPMRYMKKVQGDWGDIPLPAIPTTLNPDPAGQYQRELTAFLEQKIQGGGGPRDARVRAVQRMIRILNPNFQEKEIPDSFYDDGPGSTSTPGLRKPVVSRSVWSDMTPGSYAAAGRSPVAADTLRIVQEIRDQG